MAVKFSEKKFIGNLSKSDEKGWTTRLSLMEAISTKGTYTYFDIRKIKAANEDSEQTFGKGITLTEDELLNLKQLLNAYFED